MTGLYTCCLASIDLRTTAVQQKYARPHIKLWRHVQNVNVQLQRTGDYIHLPQLPGNSALFFDNPACWSSGTIEVETIESFGAVKRPQLPAPGSVKGVLQVSNMQSAQAIDQCSALGVHDKTAVQTYHNSVSAVHKQGLIQARCPWVTWSAPECE